ncbi:MAG TPA: TolC family protein [Haliangiales bacterium]|nr:TolC family protein [Haliangiales bacterium]
MSFCWSLRAAHSQTAAPVRRVTLDELVDRAKKSDRVEAARDKLRGAEARRDLVRAMWIPQLEITATGGPGPEITCLPSPEMCTSTNVKSVYRIGDQPTFRIDGTVTMPLYTFGKLSHGSDAADEGLAAAQASVEASRADVALEVARVYYGLKLAREILIMLEEGRGHVTVEIDRIERELDKGKTNVSEYDRYRMRSLLTEIDARRSETQRSVADALVAIRALCGDDAIDIDDAPLAELPAVALGTGAEAREMGRDKRPEHRAVNAGVKAQEHLATIEELRWLPDIVLRLGGTVARDPGADVPFNAYYNNQLNVTGVWAVIAMHWTLDGTRPGRVREQNAELDHARTSERLVGLGLGWEAQSAWNAAQDARRRLDAVRAGDAAAHSWVVAVLQNTELGTAEPRDLNEALQAYFIMHARLYSAMYDWNVGLHAFARATGRDWRELLPKQ